MAEPDDALRGAVNRLEAFVRSLRQRPDLEVHTSVIGEGASEAELARYPELPAELRDLYRRMNGIHVEWRFVEPPGGGCIRIPPASEWTRFGGDDTTYMNFGPTLEAVLLDEIQPEGASWLVRGVAASAVRIVFAPSGRGHEAIEVPGGVARYLELAMESGFGEWWPACFKENKAVSYAAQEAAIARFRASPREPSAIAPGARVHAESFAEGARGTVLRLHEAPAGRAVEFHGTTIVEVALDEGTVAWIPKRWLRAQTRIDSYERLRLTLPTIDPAHPLPMLEELARALGPTTSVGSSVIGNLVNNARLAAGILGIHRFEAVIPFVVDLYDAAIKARLSFTEPLPTPLHETGDELDPVRWADHQWQLKVGGLFDALFDGLLLVCHHRSHVEMRPGKELVEPALQKRLTRAGKAQRVLSALASASVLAQPTWHAASGDVVRELGLPEGSILFSGTGM